MRRTWTEIGNEAELSRDDVAEAIDALNWTDVPETMAASPGLAIKRAIAELRIPKVSQLAVSLRFAPYELYGIEGNYKNGRARVYILDRGSDLLPLASDFWPKES